MEEAVAQIVSPNDPPESEAAERFTDRVQQLRNTSYELQKNRAGRKSARRKKETGSMSEEVWKRGYAKRNGTLPGFFWDWYGRPVSRLMACYVSDRQKLLLYPRDDGPYAAGWQNVVSGPKRTAKEIYFDPGALFTPFALLEWSENRCYRIAARQRTEGTWIRSTLPQSSESRTERKAGTENSLTQAILKGKLTVYF